MVTTPPTGVLPRSAAPSETPRIIVVGAALSAAFWWGVRSQGVGRSGYVAAALFLALAAWCGIAALRRRHLEAVSVLAYLAAVEPAMRGFAERLPYLSLEYLTVLIAGIVVLHRRAPMRPPALWLTAYLLLEGAGVALAADPEDARWMAVMTAARLALLLLLARTDLSGERTYRVLGAFLIGTSSMALLALAGSLGGAAHWSLQSNSLAAGGFGPNQVAGLLAFGAFGFIAFSERLEALWLKLFFLGAAGVHLLASLLTFTRGGSLILAFGLLTFLIVMQLHRRVPWTLVAALGLGGLVFLAAAELTGQLLIQRYQDTQLSGREMIWRLGVDIFWQNPLFGVGTGNFYAASEGRLLQYRGQVGTHNEFIRALSEHGIVGITLWIGFLLSCAAECWRGRRGLERATALGWLTMAVAFESHSGLKLGASLFLVALAIESFRSRPAPETASRNACEVAGDVKRPRFGFNPQEVGEACPSRAR